MAPLVTAPGGELISQQRFLDQLEAVVAIHCKKHLLALVYLLLHHRAWIATQAQNLSHPQWAVRPRSKSPISSPAFNHVPNIFLLMNPGSRNLILPDEQSPQTTSHAARGMGLRAELWPMIAAQEQRASVCVSDPNEASSHSSCLSSRDWYLVLELRGTRWKVPIFLGWPWL